MRSVAEREKNPDRRLRLPSVYSVGNDVRLFRQPAMDDWASVNKKIARYLSWFKV